MSDIVFVLDVSGSISDTELEKAKYAAQAFLGASPSVDDIQFAVIFFGSEAHIVQPLTDDKSLVSAAIASISRTAESTFIGSGLQAATNILLAGRLDAKKIIVLFSDGGDPDASVEAQTILIADAAKFEHGIKIICMHVQSSSSDRNHLSDISTIRMMDGNRYETVFDVPSDTEAAQVMLDIYNAEVPTGCPDPMDEDTLQCFGAEPIVIDLSTGSRMGVPIAPGLSDSRWKESRTGISSIVRQPEAGWFTLPGTGWIQADCDATNGCTDDVTTFKTSFYLPPLPEGGEGIARIDWTVLAHSIEPKHGDLRWNSNLGTFGRQIGPILPYEAPPSNSRGLIAGQMNELAVTVRGASDLALDVKGSVQYCAARVTNELVLPMCVRCGPPALQFASGQNLNWSDYPIGWDIDLSTFPAAEQQEWEQAAIDAAAVWNAQMPITVFQRSASSNTSVNIRGIRKHDNYFLDMFYDNNPYRVSFVHHGLGILQSPLNISCLGRRYARLPVYVMLDRATFTDDTCNPYNMDVRDWSNMLVPRRYMLVHELGLVLGLDEYFGTPMWPGLDRADDDGIFDGRGCLTAADAADFNRRIRMSMLCLLRNSISP